MWNDLTIVTSCHRYGGYLGDWLASIVGQTMRPKAVCIFTHGSAEDEQHGRVTALRLKNGGMDVRHQHVAERLDFGEARNRAVAMAETEWVLHLDADDSLMPHAIAMCKPLAPDADVISAGYVRTGKITSGMSVRDRVYADADGVLALDLPAICSSNSPFRKSFWERSPYRTDMFGAWDTALWIGFAHLGARFRATPKPIFNYRQHPDSVFTVRQNTMSWARVHTSAMLRALRRAYSGVTVIVPRDYAPDSDRARNWARVAQHYAFAHPTWNVVEGRSPAKLWCKGAAIDDALNHSNAEILVIADADCLVDPRALNIAVNAVKNGAPWAMPHTMVRRLSADATITLLPEIPEHLNLNASQYPLVRDVYEGAPGGGIVVIKRVMYDAIGGIPHAFCGWGSEDRALACLCETLLGPCMRGTAELLHLYHAPQPKTGLTTSNLQILRRLGNAALSGKDALVAAIKTLPKAGVSTKLAIPRMPVKEIDLATLQERQSFLARKRRRMP